jgi:hypothetical protein
MSNLAANELTKKKFQLEKERDKMLEDFNSQIKELEFAIEKLMGGSVHYFTNETNAFDDDHPDYIKMSQEEI